MDGMMKRPISKPEKPIARPGEDKCVIKPGELIPPQVLDVLKTWTAFRCHPAWSNHWQINPEWQALEHQPHYVPAICHPDRVNL